MAVTTGVDVFIGDAEAPIWTTSSYSVVEDSTPTDPSDASGGYGQITVGVPDRPGIKALSGKKLRLVDGVEGETTGTIRGRSGNGFVASVVADSRIAKLSVTRRADPFAGTLRDALLYYFGLCGLTDGIVIDETIGAIGVALPGWNDNVYEKVRGLAPAYDFEMSLVSQNVVIRPLRERVTVDYRDSQVDWTVDESGLAQYVEGYYYNNEWRGSALAYPPGGWNEDVQVLTVDAGATQVYDLELSASLSSIEQPACVSSVDRFYSATSVYTVVGNDGLVILPEQWAADGGSLTVEIGKDTTSLKVTLVGGRSTQYAPYSIAMASGTSDEYSSLRVVGTGVFTEKTLVRLPACLDTDLAPDEVGVTVENPAFRTYDQLYHALLRTAARYGTSRQSINVTTRGVNRVGQSGSYRYPTIGDVQTLYPGATIADLYAELGPTIADWNEKLFATVRSDFDNQSFGNVAGARTRKDDCWYRIRTATKGPLNVSYQAERDNTVGDVYRTGETIGQWNARWAGKTILDVDLAPLMPL